MTTNAVMPLPNPTPTVGQVIRTSHPTRNGEENQAAETLSVRGSSRSQDSKVNSAANNHQSNFQETLKKRLGQNSNDLDRPKKENPNGKTPQTVTVEGVQIVSIEPPTPVVIKINLSQLKSRQVSESKMQTLQFGNNTKKDAIPKQSTITASVPKLQDVADTKTISIKAEIPPIKQENTTKNVRMKAETAVITTEKQPVNKSISAKFQHDVSPKTAEALNSQPKEMTPAALKNASGASTAPIKTDDVLTTQKPNPDGVTEAAQRSSVTVKPTVSLSSASSEKTEYSLRNGDNETSGPHGNNKLAFSASESATPTFIDSKEGPMAASDFAKPGYSEAAVQPPLPTVQASTSGVTIDPTKPIDSVTASRPVEQIVQHLQLRTFGSESQVRLMLSPEDLGAIRITFRQSDNEVVGLLEVQKTDTRKEIERSVSQLTAAMESTGLQVRRIEVVPWNTPSQHPRGEQFGQEFDASQHREMYRSDGRNETQTHSEKQVKENSEGTEIAIKSRTTAGPEMADSGLNLFI